MAPEHHQKQARQHDHDREQLRVLLEDVGRARSLEPVVPLALRALGDVVHDRRAVHDVQEGRALRRQREHGEHPQLALVPPRAAQEDGESGQELRLRLVAREEHAHSRDRQLLQVHAERRAHELADEHGFEDARGGQPVRRRVGASGSTPGMLSGTRLAGARTGSGSR